MSVESSILRLREDFLYAAESLFKVSPKGSAEQKPFTLMSGQAYIHARLEDQRKRRGLVRAIIVKPRQIGATSYLAARNAHRAFLNTGIRVFLVAHDLEIAKEVLGKVQDLHKDLPPKMRPKPGLNNTTELSLDGIRSWFKVASANRSDVGRGMSPTVLHGTEVAYWNFADEIMAGLSTGVAWAPGTEIVLESTAKGPEGYFYEEAMKASRGESDYELIFVPWMWQTEYARSDFPDTWEPDEDEQALAQQYDLTKEQLWWRNRELTKKSLTKFRREFPATLEEAFMSDIEGALWKRADVRIAPTPLPEMKRVVIGVDPAVTSNKKSDETGIVVAGLGMDDVVYVLKDASGKMPVEVWAKRVIDLYHEYGADKIIAETNNGGDAITAALFVHDRGANVVGKHVHNSKVARHEPVAGLYRRRKVLHASPFNTLVDQMCTWNPITHPKDSPDRVDALTLAVADLTLQMYRVPMAYVP